ncbi:probable helicase MAGATAMA 3 [Physcomitrium patens]|uniref:Helicase ATP-binding domain-containing protein n=1 Tax=Physcomitrium patens TaxID=3218 RepID=A0A7I4E2C2_PHYPA|nr:probable helicase MAGATAMA 3 [Physcomitrium patens]|eukprot:XP_024378491.1 probable helicase MAGATAMA 3 [Physcomitrella patens]
MGTNAMGAARQDRAAQVASHHTRLQKSVLAWDYIRIVTEDKANQKKRKASDLAKGSALRNVPDKFKDLDEYLEVFESLLLEECRAQILRGDEEEGARQCHMVAVIQCERVNEFHFVKLAIDAGECQEYYENDLVLLSKEQLGQGKLPSTYALANVESREGQQALRIRMYLDKEAETGISIENDASDKVLASLSGPKTAWWILKLCNMSTISREYTSLRSVGTLPFVKTILSASLVESDDPESAKDSGQWTIPPSLLDHLNHTHNVSQLQAIQAGCSRDPLVLIQGPPGTGKTQTILGLLSVVLHSTPVRQPFKNGDVSIQHKLELTSTKRMDHWIKASPWLNESVNPRDLIMPMDGDDGFFPTSTNQFRPESIAAKRKHRKHVLVCAPSNSALDEIVLRLLNTGLRDENGQAYTPNVVRVGLNAHHSVSAVTMDTLVNQRLSGVQKSVVSAGPKASAGMERDRCRISILDEAAIVCSTLSFSGAGVFLRMNRGFDVVIIDEAAQAVEPSTLVPLVHGCRQVFLVGDPLQLPATVLSTKAVSHGYGMSMFKRLQKAGYPVKMLKTQYRMHPLIRAFPSKEFYEGALEDGDDVERVTSRPWHEHRCFGPYTFFDIDGEESQPPGSGSWVNKDEVEFVLVLYRHLVALYPELKGSPTVAVISPYKLQVKLLRQRFTEVLGKETARLVDINTVDGFQGREKDIAIFSCVRATEGKSIGFVSDFRRMNVGLTRARASMLVVGCAKALKIDKHWRNLVTSSIERHRLYKVTKPFHALFNDQSLENMKKLAEQYEEEEAKRKLAEPDTPAVITDVEDTNMDELLDAYADEDVDEIAENFGDVDEDVEDI